MNRYILILCLMVIPLFAQSQKRNLEQMSDEERKTYLKVLAVEVVKNFGPEWYRDDLIPEVSDSTIMFDETEDDYDQKEIYSNYGRHYYSVALKYTPEVQKELIYRNAANVQIWADDGEPLGIDFGNMMGYNFLFVSYRSWIKAGVTKEQQMKFHKIEMPKQTGRGLSIPFD